MTELTHTHLSPPPPPPDPYANLYEMEVPDAVDSVLKNMLSKEVVKDTFK